VDVRVIAATNRKLEEMVRQGSFRLDLFYRINSVNIQLPALRERRQDIPLLCEHFISLYNKEHRKSVKGLTDGAERILLEYDFPGNIRELSNILELAVILCSDQTIHVKDILAQMKQAGLPESAPSRVAVPPLGHFSGMTLNEIEKEVIRDRLAENNGHQKRTAQQLGISVKGLRNKILYYGLSVK